MYNKKDLNGRAIKESKRCQVQLQALVGASSDAERYRLWQVCLQNSHKLLVASGVTGILSRYSACRIAAFSRTQGLI